MCMKGTGQLSKRELLKLLRRWLPFGMAWTVSQAECTSAWQAISLWLPLPSEPDSCSIDGRLRDTYGPHESCTRIIKSEHRIFCRLEKTMHNSKSSKLYLVVTRLPFPSAPRLSTDRHWVLSWGSAVACRGGEWDYDWLYATADDLACSVATEKRTQCHHNHVPSSPLISKVKWHTC